MSATPEAVLEKALATPFNRPTVIPIKGLSVSFVTVLTAFGISVQPRTVFFAPLLAFSAANADKEDTLITKDIKNTEGGFARIAVGVETLNRLKQLAGSSSLSGYLSGLSQELLNGQQTELLPRLKGQISLASLKLAIDGLAARIDRLEEIITGIVSSRDKDSQNNT